VGSWLSRRSVGSQKGQDQSGHSGSGVRVSRVTVGQEGERAGGTSLGLLQQHFQGAKFDV
jgi:hypothetical protein